MRILIIRHGEPNYAIDSLTEKGFREAELLAQRIFAIKPDAVYCSPLGRAQDTAGPSLRLLEKEAVILPWLREFPATVPAANGAERMIPWNLHPQYWTKEKELFDAERWRQQALMASGDVDVRYGEVVRGLDDLLLSYGYQRDGYLYRCEDNRPLTIALFCHFALGMVLMGHLLGFSASQLWQTLFMPASSVTTLVTEERTKGEVMFKCMQLGDTSHLYAGNEPVSSAGLFPECYDGNETGGAKA